MDSTTASSPDAAETAVAAWQARMGLTDRDAAARLGMTQSGYGRNKRGRDEHGRVREPSRVLLLACAAIEAGLSPVGPRSP